MRSRSLGARNAESERRRVRRAQETPEQHEERLAKGREQARKRRENMSEEQKAKVRLRNLLRIQEIRRKMKEAGTPRVRTKMQRRERSSSVSSCSSATVVKEEPLSGEEYDEDGDDTEDSNEASSSKKAKKGGRRTIANRTPEEVASQRRKWAMIRRIERANETLEQRQTRLNRHRDYQRRKRETMDEAEKAKIRENNRLRKRKEKETRPTQDPEAKKETQLKDSITRKVREAMEDPLEREARLAKSREITKKRRELKRESDPETYRQKNIKQSKLQRGKRTKGSREISKVSNEMKLPNETVLQKRVRNRIAKEFVKNGGSCDALRERLKEVFYSDEFYEGLDDTLVENLTLGVVPATPGASSTTTETEPAAPQEKKFPEEDILNFDAALLEPEVTTDDEDTDQKMRYDETVEDWISRVYKDDTETPRASAVHKSQAGAAKLASELLEETEERRAEKIAELEEKARAMELQAAKETAEQRALRLTKEGQPKEKPKSKGGTGKWEMSKDQLKNLYLKRKKQRERETPEQKTSRRAKAAAYHRQRHSMEKSEKALIRMINEDTETLDVESKQVYIIAVLKESNVQKSIRFWNDIKVFKTASSKVSEWRKLAFSVMNCVCGTVAETDDDHQIIKESELPKKILELVETSAVVKQHYNTKREKWNDYYKEKIAPTLVGKWKENYRKKTPEQKAAYLESCRARQKARCKRVEGTIVRRGRKPMSSNINHNRLQQPRRSTQPRRTKSKVEKRKLEEEESNSNGNDDDNSEQKEVYYDDSMEDSVEDCHTGEEWTPQLDFSCMLEDQNHLNPDPNSDRVLRSSFSTLEQHAHNFQAAHQMSSYAASGAFSQLLGNFPQHPNSNSSSNSYTNNNFNSQPHNYGPPNSAHSSHTTHHQQQLHDMSLINAALGNHSNYHPNLGQAFHPPPPNAHHLNSIEFLPNSQVALIGVPGNSHNRSVHSHESLGPSFNYLNYPPQSQNQHTQSHNIPSQPNSTQQRFGETKPTKKRGPRKPSKKSLAKIVDNLHRTETKAEGGGTLSKGASKACSPPKVPKIIAKPWKPVEKIPPEKLARLNEIKKAFIKSCPECSMTFKKIPMYKRHMRDVHREKQKYQCKVCPFSGKCRSILADHLWYQHYSPGSTEPFSPYRCPLCPPNGRHILKRDKVTLHLSIKHKAERKTSFILGVSKISGSDQWEKFYCCKCPELFKSYNEVADHFNNQHVERDMGFCSVCGILLHDKEQMDEHFLRLHLNALSGTTEQNGRLLISGDKNSFFKCNDCESLFSSKEFLIQHNDEGHPRLGNSTSSFNYSCPTCDKRFEFKALLKEHVAKARCPGSNFPCHVCKMRFKEAEECQNHLKEAHPGFDVTVGLLTDGRLRYKCEYCRRSFRQIISLRLHSYFDHVKKPDPAEKADSSQGAETVEPITRKEVTVEVTVEYFPPPDLTEESLTSLYSTVKRANETRQLNALADVKFPCYICSTVMESRDSWGEHMKASHPEEDPEFRKVCPVCHKRFTSSVISWRHYSQNHTEKRFRHRCPFCHIAFARLEHVRNHVRNIHEGDNANWGRGKSRGGVCRKKDVLEGTEEAAESLKLLPFPCEICNCNYKTEATLANHMKKIHLNDRVLTPCRYCNRVMDADIYSAHIRKRHPEMVEAETKVPFSIYEKVPLSRVLDLIAELEENEGPWRRVDGLEHSRKRPRNEKRVSTRKSGTKEKRSKKRDESDSEEEVLVEGEGSCEEEEGEFSSEDEDSFENSSSSEDDSDDSTGENQNMTPSPFKISLRELIIKPQTEWSKATSASVSNLGLKRQKWVRSRHKESVKKTDTVNLREPSNTSERPRQEGKYVKECLIKNLVIQLKRCDEC